MSTVRDIVNMIGGVDTHSEHLWTQYNFVSLHHDFVAVES